MASLLMRLLVGAIFIASLGWHYELMLVTMKSTTCVADHWPSSDTPAFSHFETAEQTTERVAQNRGLPEHQDFRGARRRSGCSPPCNLTGNFVPPFSQLFLGLYGVHRRKHRPATKS